MGGKSRGSKISVKEFIVCSPPVVILVPINLLARLEPETIWKNCRVYKTDMEQHPRALTSHTNLEMIKMALVVFTAEDCLQRAAHQRHLEFSLAGLET